MKKIRVELFLILLLLCTACGKSENSKTEGSGAVSGDVTGNKSQEVDVNSPLYRCFADWSDLKKEILRNGNIQNDHAAQLALGFMSRECLKESDLEVLQKVYDVYIKIDPSDIKATDWNKAETYVNLKRK